MNAKQFLGKKIWRNIQVLKSKKLQGILGETFILALLSSAAVRLQNHVSDLFFHLSCSGSNHNSSLGNDVDFSDIKNVSPNIWLKIKILINLDTVL